MAPPLGTKNGPLQSLEAYNQTREALIQQEHSQSFHANAQESALEARARETVQRIKRLEEKTLKGVSNDGSGYEAATKFLHSVDDIEKSNLLAIISRAPKGALLHCHFDAMLPPDGMLSDARERVNFFVKCDLPLVSKEDFEGGFPQFTVLSKSEEVELSGETNTFSEKYVAGSWMKYYFFLQQFPGGAEKAEEWITHKVVLGEEHAYHPRQTVDGIWKQFIRSVISIRGLLSYKTAYQSHFRRMLWKFAQDGIMYAELRVALNYRFYILSDNGETKLSHSDILQIFQDVLKEEVPKIRRLGFDFFGVKIIYACMRMAEEEAMSWCMENCIDLKQKFPELICGFDLQGQEDTGYPLSHWIPQLLSFREKCTTLNLDIPFILHAGETLEHGGPTDSNLYDAILLNTKRIGHGFSLTKHPLLMRLCKEKRIAVETCPLSNEILGLCGTAKGLHLPTLLANGVGCCLSSDDPGCWGANVLSHDFYQAFMSSNKIDLLTLRGLVECSIEHSCLEEDTKTQILRVLGEKWEEYCGRIIDTYGSRVNE